MTREQIETKLIDVFQSVFPTLGEDEVQRASQASVAEWDSVAAISLINAIEDEYSIELGLDDAGGLTSFDLVADYIEERTSDD